MLRMQPVETRGKTEGLRCEMDADSEPNGFFFPLIPDGINPPIPQISPGRWDAIPNAVGMELTASTVETDRLFWAKIGCIIFFNSFAPLSAPTLPHRMFLSRHRITLFLCPLQDFYVCFMQTVVFFVELVFFIYIWSFQSITWFAVIYCGSYRQSEKEGATFLFSRLNEFVLRGCNCLLSTRRDISAEANVPFSPTHFI